MIFYTLTWTQHQWINQFHSEFLLDRKLKKKLLSLVDRKAGYQGNKTSSSGGGEEVGVSQNVHDTECKLTDWSSHLRNIYIIEYRS